MATVANHEANGAASGERQAPVYLRLRDLMRMMTLAGTSLFVPADAGRLIAEVLRLRAKVRGQQCEIRALRLERDALAQLVVAYAPKTEQR